MQPATAVVRLSLMLVSKAGRNGDLKSVRTFATVQPPCTPLNDPSSTSPAGMKRKSRAYAKNGSVPSHASGRRLRPAPIAGRSASGAASVAVLGPHLRRPLAGDERLRLRLLVVRCELDLRVERRRRKLREQGLRDHLPLGEILEAGRVRVALEPDQLALVGVEELVSEPCRPRMRCGRVDRLAVVRAVDAVRRDDRLPLRGRELRAVTEVQVVP